MSDYEALQKKYDLLEQKQMEMECMLRQIFETAQEHPAKANYMAVHRQIIGFAREMVERSERSSIGSQSAKGVAIE